MSLLLNFMQNNFACVILKCNNYSIFKNIFIIFISKFEYDYLSLQLTSLNFETKLLKIEEFYF